MKKHKKKIAFLLKFFAIFAFAEILIFYVDFSALENFIAAQSASYFGLPWSGNAIFVPDGTFLITSSCTGLVSMSILAAIIFSLRKPKLEQKFGIFIAGAALLFILNYIRVFLVVGIGKYHGIAAGEIAHVISWFTTAALVLILWYYFTKKVAKVKDFAGFL